MPAGYFVRYGYSLRLHHAVSAGVGLRDLDRGAERNHDVAVYVLRGFAPTAGDRVRRLYGATERPRRSGVLTLELTLAVGFQCLADGGRHECGCAAGHETSAE